MEAFIEAIRKQQCLWHPDHKDYRNAQKREEAWLKIAQLNIRDINDVATAKMEWKKLRDNHRDSLKRHKDKTVNTWKHGAIMNFLLPFMKTRDKSLLRSGFNSTEDHEAVDVEFVPVEYEQSTASDEMEYNEERDTTRKRTGSDIMELVKEIEKIQQKRPKHPIESFFESMAESTKLMPTYLQNRIKRKILDVVCEAEEEMQNCSLSTTVKIESTS